ncbi:FAD-binding oxidoreductase [Chroococcidiopsis sp. CCMEE 29]|uniref:FAD-binding oxidoreductase n=1 Tax=Chroococcidiopsis sp. CCMEE 29 TaxID=155894 RepID=UPI00201FEA2F|nr:FAD-binding oxidoreductase [Chroococcidiopsis sp. CCMEE 29]
MVNPSVTTTTGEETVLEEAVVEALKSSLRGELLRPGDAGYDDARPVWNGMIDRYPALIARCTGESDVITTVNFARTHNLLVAVRGGGHNVAGNATCDRGLVIDLSLMKSVRVDPKARVARVQGGATWGDVDRETQSFNLATPGGLVSETGIAGLTLGGGFGWLRGKYGLSCDNLISVDVVTADGQLLKASETENSDLFWAIRGGGGNFGIVTSFEYRLHPVGPEVMFVFVFHHGDKTRDALRFYREYCATAVDEVTSLAVCGIIPSKEPFPEEIYGMPFVLFAACYAGAVEEGKQVLQPLRDFSEPLIDFSGAMPYLQVQTIFDEDYPAHKLRYYWKALNLKEMSDEAIARIVEHARSQVSPLATTDIWQISGAVRQIGEAETAFSGRQAAFMFNVEANWIDPQEDEANITWVRQFVDAMQEFSDGSRYFNFPGFLEEGDAAVQATFGAKYERLVALKNKYDPTNLFRLNQNIKPTGAVSYS